MLKLKRIPNVDIIIKISGNKNITAQTNPDVPVLIEVNELQKL